MKFIHTSDLHIGKVVHEMSMIEEQRHMLRQLIELTVKEQAEALVIAGDIYDRAIPSTEAVELLDDFLTEMSEKKIPVILINGNHDSPKRVSFADRILEKQGVHIAGGYEGELKQVVLEDEFGPVYFVCMPFVKPSAAGAATSEEAVRNMLSACPMVLSANSRYVLLTHYFVTGEGGEEPLLSDSESTVNVGGLDNVPASLFESFSYTALGHIHRAQQIGSGPVYYSGSPIKYAFSEATQEKSVNLVTLGLKGLESVEKLPLRPLHDMRIIKGRLEELIREEVCMAADREDYIQAVLTNEEELIEPMDTLRRFYPNIMQIVLEKGNREAGADLQPELFPAQMGTEALFAKFYEAVSGQPLDEKRKQIVVETVEAVEGREL